MKKILTFTAAVFAMALFGQKTPKMAPVYSPGYFVNQRGDTVRGDIQTNVDDETLFYHQFAFKPKRSNKSRVYNTQRASAYGVDGKNFVRIEYKGEKFFVERLAQGRLGFYEYRFNGKVNGLPAIESSYFVRDHWAEDKAANLSKLSNKFYKKSLKPFFIEEKPEIWERLDKFHFDEQVVVEAIREFNDGFATTAN
jgi:hypothetical protein